VKLIASDPVKVFLNLQMANSSAASRTNANSHTKFLGLTGLDKRRILLVEMI